VTHARPNIVLILADDLGYSDLGCFGGEIATPNLDALAERGVRGTAFYNTARCSPSRASLLTGRHPHETGVAVLTDDLRAHGGYPGTLRADVATLAERLRDAGYQTCLAGKWHLSSDTSTPNWSWPTRRGFDEFYGILQGADSFFHPKDLWHNEDKQPVPAEGFYFTEAISEHAATFIEKSVAPFFLYLADTAPHWPLQAPEAEIERYQGVYDAGWDELRRSRHERMRASGILGEEARLSDRDPTQPAWEGVEEPAWQARRMSVYAAQVAAMDAGVGRVLDALRATGTADSTLVIFLSDNGASAEELPEFIGEAPRFRQRQTTQTPDGRAVTFGNRPDVAPGSGLTYASYGRRWANLSNTPFRFYKRWVHEGGIATPLIATWPSGGLDEGQILRTPYQLTDMMPTILEATGIDHEDCSGVSMLDALRDVTTGVEHTLFWEHVGNAAVRRGRWKLVREADAPWELYDMESDRSELHDRAVELPHLVDELAAEWDEWARSVGVVEWAQLREVVGQYGG
jgi:arylsulfatase A-like enzyme